MSGGGPFAKAALSTLAPPGPGRCTDQQPLPHSTARPWPVAGSQCQWLWISTALPQSISFHPPIPHQSPPSFLLHLFPPSPNLLCRSQEGPEHTTTASCRLYFPFPTQHIPPPFEIPNFPRVVSAGCPVFRPGLTSLSFSPSFSPNYLVRCRLRRCRPCTFPPPTIPRHPKPAPPLESNTTLLLSTWPTSQSTLPPTTIDTGSEGSVPRYQNEQIVEHASLARADESGQL